MKQQPVAEHDLFGLVTATTQCINCDKTLPLTEAVISTFHITPYVTETRHFCSGNCAEAWWRAKQ